MKQQYSQTETLANVPQIPLDHIMKQKYSQSDDTIDGMKVGLDHIMKQQYSQTAQNSYDKR